MPGGRQHNPALANPAVRSILRSRCGDLAGLTAFHPSCISSIFSTSCSSLPRIAVPKIAVPRIAVEGGGHPPRAFRGQPEVAL